MRHGARRRHEAVRHRFAVEIAEQAAAGDACDARLRVDAHVSQQRQVDHHATVASRFPGRAVAAAFDGQQQIRGVREIHGLLHVGRAARLHDQRRVLVDLSVDHAPRVFVRRMPREQHVAAQTVGELLHHGARQRDALAVTCDGVDVAVDFRCRAKHGGKAGGSGQRRCDGSGQRAAEELTTVQHWASFVGRPNVTLAPRICHDCVRRASRFGDTMGRAMLEDER